MGEHPNLSSLYCVKFGEPGAEFAERSPQARGVVARLPF